MTECGELINDSLRTIEAVGSPPQLPQLDIGGQTLDAAASAAANQHVVNRSIRPGMIATPPRRITSVEPPLSSGSMKRSISLPQTTALMVDGFDFDKNDCMNGIPRSPFDSLRDLPENSRSDGLDLSPLYQKLTRPHEASLLRSPDDKANKLVYGATTDDADGTKQAYNVVATRQLDQNSSHAFHEADFLGVYKKQGAIPKAFSGRMGVLVTVALLEIPVFWAIASNRIGLCSVIGRRRYDLWMGFVFLSNALAGCNGLHTSSVTSGAVRQQVVRSKPDLGRWVVSETIAATFVGIVFGFLVGLVAFMMSDFDSLFALSISMAQIVGFATSGMFGALAPYIVEIGLGYDAQKWAGQVVAAIQDVVGSLAMVFLSYQLLSHFGTTSTDDSSC